MASATLCAPLSDHPLTPVPAQSPEDQLRALEQRYTRLLEARVSELERKLGGLDGGGRASHPARVDHTPHASDTETEGDIKVRPFIPNSPNQKSSQPQPKAKPDEDAADDPPK